MTEEEKLVADLGKPKLGERNLIRIHIRESKEFKVDKLIWVFVFQNEIYFVVSFLKNAIDKALYKANTAILVGTSTWLEQFKQAFSVKG